MPSGTSVGRSEFAVRYVRGTALNAISDYAIAEGAAPQPAPGQVQIKVAACGIGYVDVLVALGGYQVKPSLPHTPGQEIAGTVAAIGDGVTDFSVGDRVLAAAQGGFAEYAVAPLGSVVRIPESLAFAAAASLRLNYLTALHGLRDRATLQKGERLLVLGAAGGVGIAAVQIGKLLGAEVIAVASTEEKRAFARQGGADRVLDSAVEGWRDRLKGACNGGGPDVVFDPLCGHLFEPAFRSLAWRGRHLVVGFVGGEIPRLRVNLPLMKGAALVGVDVRQFVLFERAKAAAEIEELIAWAGEGRLSPAVGRRFPFTDFAAAMAHAHSGRGMGKTVLEIA
ncbi:MAG: NADPH:quinone oxidoreductase family protein [Reyranella sp.]|nr:NADPH:quinone oxidoreductase family protein [Reyranella sp.]